jgi:hypothetical protein
MVAVVEFTQINLSHPLEACLNSPSPIPETRQLQVLPSFTKRVRSLSGPTNLTSVHPQEANRGRFQVYRGTSLTRNRPPPRGLP